MSMAFCRLPSSCLPEDVMIDILERLPVKSLLRFKCVSKSWRDFIDSKEFVNRHLARSMTDQYQEKNVLLFGVRQYNPYGRLASYKFYTAKYDTPENFTATVEELYQYYDQKNNIGDLGDLEIVGACNGLVCMRNRGHCLLLFNPWTKTDCVVPEVPVGKLDKFSVSYGFGHDCVSDDYKVVSLLDHYDFGSCQIRIYDKNSNSWRITEELKNYTTVHPQDEGGVLVNSALHWMLWRSSAPCILAFDLRTEKCRFVPPPPPEENPNATFKVANLDGHLSVIADHNIMFADGFASYCIWKMNDYGVEGSWTKLTRVKIPLRFYHWSVVAYSEANKEWIYSRQGLTEGAFFWANYERRSRPQKVLIPRSGLHRLMPTIMFCVPSLVPATKYGAATKPENYGQNDTTLKRTISLSIETSSKKSRSS